MLVQEVRTPLLAAGGLCGVWWVGSSLASTGPVCKLALQYLKKEEKEHAQRVPLMQVQLR